MRAKDFIVEYDRSKTAQNWGQKLLAVTRKDPSMTEIVRASPTGVNIEWLLGQFETADPTPHKEYVQWLAKQYSTGLVKFEDIISRGKDALTKFNEMKLRRQLQPAQADVNRLTFAQLEDVAMQYQPKVPEPEKAKGQAQQYYEDAQVRVIMPRDKEAACYYGQGTKWCTAATSNNMFDHYAKKGELYIVIPKQPQYAGEKYQFSFADRQFMNERDISVSPTILVNRWPQMAKIFEKQAVQHNVMGFLIPTDELVDEWEFATEEAVSDAVVYISKNAVKIVKNMLIAVGSVAKEYHSRFATRLLSDLSDTERMATLGLDLTGMLNGLKPTLDYSDISSYISEAAGDTVDDWLQGSRFRKYADGLLESDQINEDELYDTVMPIVMDLTFMIADAVAESINKYYGQLYQSDK